MSAAPVSAAPGRPASASEEPAASRSEQVAAVAEAARAWRDPDHPARAAAVEETLAAADLFTAEALAFAVNAAMHRLTPEALRAWTAEARRPCTVGVLPAGEEPLSGLQALLAVLLAGHRFLGVAPPSALLVPAFAEEIHRRWKAMPASFTEEEEAVFEQADALLGSGDEEARASFGQRADAAGIPAARRWWEGEHFAVAVLDGEESEEEREGLAEDALLFAGRSGRSVRVVWAPAGLAPDRYLEAMAHFRAVFPPPPALPGTLEMQRAFLEAQGRSHAHGEGLEFLVSRGAPEVQPPGHVRWAEYDALDDVRAWLGTAERVSFVVARAPLAEALAPAWRCVRAGTVHRLPPGARGLEDIQAFLARLGAEEEGAR